MDSLRVEAVWRSYREPSGASIDALRGIHLTIEPGSFLCIAGPSGSGKTTLLNILGALDRPTSGHVYFGDQDTAALRQHQLAEWRLRAVGFVFQSYNLITTLTALENAEYVLVLQGQRRATIRPQVVAMLERVGLRDCLHRRVNKLSGGQQQRVAVVRAVVSHPKVVLADEPTANLDAESAGALVDLMRALNKEHGVSFIISTHDPMVMGKADRVCHMRSGRIVDAPSV